MLFNREIETCSLDKLRRLQNERLQQQVRNLYANVPYYKDLFDTHGLRPEHIQTIADLPKIPFTYKKALRDYYPFGLFARPRNEVTRLHCSSGTTGKPIVVGYTQNDLGVFSEVIAAPLLQQAVNLACSYKMPMVMAYSQEAWACTMVQKN